MPLAYVICTSPRTGSTLLCQGLTATGRAGAPAEFFDHRQQVIVQWMRRLAISVRSDFFDKVVAATSTSNGVFGTKLHWTTLNDMHRELCDALAAPAADARQRSLDELLCMKFSTVRYIWLRRRNKVAQGISHFRATRSDFWQIPKGHGGEKNSIAETIEFNFRMIDSTVAWAHEYDRRWQNYFAHHGLTPLQLFYEDFVASYGVSLRKILDFLDIPHCDLPEAEPRLERMADLKSIEWEKKYREMVAETEVPTRAN
jgi:trehalose 2-sulfotransferase